MQQLEESRWLAAYYYQTNLVDTPVARHMFESLLSQPTQLEEFIATHFPADKKSRLLDSRASQIQAGIQFAYFGHPQFPKQFQWMEYAPFLISYKGSPIWNELAGLGVVGSREMHRHSANWLETELGSFLKTHKIFTVSGGARGTDQKIHEVSIRQFCPTVMVLPSGLGQIYPKSLRSWEKELMESGGSFLTEYQFDQEIRRHHFQARNRLISALSVCTLIVQASEKSGTLITAHRALEQGRTVWVVPSHPSDVGSRGGLQLLVDGATPVRDSRDMQFHWSQESGLESRVRATTARQLELPSN